MNAAQLYTLITNKKLSISTDSRTIQLQTIYFGLRGDVFDGNSFAGAAINNGAEYAVIDNPEYKGDDRYIVVDDSYKILQEIAQIHRKNFSIPILVIGGSNGKTTTKELITAVLSKKYIVHTTKGNLNNYIGVPLTLLAMKQNTEIAVIEIGANRPVEHTELMNIVQPTHVLVTNNGADHLEGFGSLAGVRKANKEIYDWARDNGAVIFVNKNITDLYQDTEGANRIAYPTGEYLGASDLYAGIQYGETKIQTQLVGSLNELNILSAVAVGEYFDVPMNDMVDAFAQYVPTLKRSQLLQYGSTNVILDCYNANPSSMGLSLQDFFKTSENKKRVVIVGDMLELGQIQYDAHREILELISSNISTDDVVMCVGPVFSKFNNEVPFSFFQTSKDAQDFFNNLDTDSAYIFLKASRGIKLEEVIQKKFPL